MGAEILIAPGLPPLPRPLQILIVDDDKDIHHILAEIISDQHFPCDVRHAYDGQNALDMMRENCPDLLILDVRMPVMDGLALREEMLHDESLINVQIAVFTGKAMNNTELQVLLADYYIPKPTGIVALMLILNKAKDNLLTIGARVQKRQEAAVHRIDAVIEDLSRLRDDMVYRLSHQK